MACKPSIGGSENYQSCEGLAPGFRAHNRLSLCASCRSRGPGCCSPALSAVAATAPLMLLDALGFEKPLPWPGCLKACEPH